MSHPVPPSPRLPVCSSRRLIRFTRFGWYYLFFSLAVGAAAINTGNNLLYLILGLLLGLIILSGLLSDSCLWGSALRVKPFGDLYAKKTSSWDVTLAKTWFPAVTLHVELLWDGLVPSTLLFPFVPRYEQATEAMSLTPTQRGPLHLRGFHVSTGFPFGLLEKFYRRSHGESWVVFPEIVPLSVMTMQSLGKQQADQPAARRGQGATPFDLREYHAGDSRNRIHWKASAKRGQWMVSEMEDEQGASPALVVTAWPSAASLEPFISFVASLAVWFSRQGQAVSLRTPGAFLEAQRSELSPKRILQYLALVQPHEENRMTKPLMDQEGIDVLALWKARS